jgi:ferredoxin
VGATKGECQRVAAVSDYEVPVVGLHVIAPEERPNASTRGYSDCIECGVHFDRDDKHRYGDYCGRNCAEDAAGRLMDLIGQGIKLKDIDGRPLRIGPARPNEPDFRPD